MKLSIKNTTITTLVFGLTAAFGATTTLDWNHPSLSGALAALEANGTVLVTDVMGIAGCDLTIDYTGNGDLDLNNGVLRSNTSIANDQTNTVTFTFNGVTNITYNNGSTNSLNDNDFISITGASPWTDTVVSNNNFVPNITSTGTTSTIDGGQVRGITIPLLPLASPPSASRILRHHHQVETEQRGNSSASPAQI